jgi:thiosulfate dehydrogenase
MIQMTIKRLKVSIAVASLLGILMLVPAKIGEFFAIPSVAARQNPQKPSPDGEKGSKTEPAPLIVQLCDGRTQMQVAGVREGEVLPPERARELAAKMLAVVAQEQAKQASKWTPRDRLTWSREEKRIIDEGNKLFHDWKALGGTIGISCDMCHPNASNTHPETYPKFQTQTKKVSALRDMINWCIENPMKGKPIALDDPRMLALEAYIVSQRKGVALDPGKH